MTLCIFKYLRVEDEQSPEFRYLQSVCLARAREVFTHVELRTWRTGVAEPDRGGDGGYVLLLGRENVWLTVSTLRKMKAAIDHGAGHVTPARLTDFRLDDLDPLYTARDFEQLEQRLDDERRVPRTLQASYLPVSMFSRAAFEALVARVPISRLLTEPASLTDISASGETVGLFHQFADYYGETRADLLPYLPPTAEDVLEVGCGRGLTGKLIQERLGCRVTGVEQHPDVAADAARHLSRVIVGNILTVELDGRYDAIVASELFEHLDDPDAFLRKMTPLLKPDGRIVLSVPNVGHYSVVEDLLAGRWDYVPAGLLCYTHLRFFTRQTLADWMARLGFACTIVAQTTDLPERFANLPATFACDIDSLRTRGFYVILRPGSAP
jgi:SAM-dependent methyltransferase